MLPTEVYHLLKKFKKRTFIYDWEYFSRRIHEELFRSVAENTPLLYIEIPFAVVEHHLTDLEARGNFWKVFFEYIERQKRICDICGVLSGDVGIAIVFLDILPNCDIEMQNGFNRMCNSIYSKSFIDIRKWDEITGVIYPPNEFFKEK
ncbi:hypothetical protein AGMMS49938_02860 [Fibrobacterales bacterium]|nr:hypothetical protein AGMMS49938_02860 [Fibrobacterales bacterium]